MARTHCQALCVQAHDAHDLKSDLESLLTVVVVVVVVVVHLLRLRNWSRSSRTRRSSRSSRWRWSLSRKVLLHCRINFCDHHIALLHCAGNTFIRAWPFERRLTLLSLFKQHTKQVVLHRHLRKQLDLSKTAMSKGTIFYSQFLQAPPRFHQ